MVDEMRYWSLLLGGSGCSLLPPNGAVESAARWQEDLAYPIRCVMLPRNPYRSWGWLQEKPLSSGSLVLLMVRVRTHACWSVGDK